MPSLDKDTQRALGERMAAIAEPLPRDERLLLYIAGFYGEARAQGLSAAGAVDLVTRVVRIHESGQLVHLGPGLDTACPTCGRGL